MKGVTGWLRDRKLPPPTYQGNITRLFIFYALYNAMFFSPIWVVFLQQERGLSLFQVTLIDVSFWATSLLFSLPIGILADSFGRKRSMMLAVVFVIISVILFVVAPSFPLLMLANIFYSLAFALEFGAALSLFYDSLKQVGREEEYTKQRGMLSAVMFASAAVSSALGGLLGDIDLRLPFLVYAGVNLFTIFILVSLKETPYEPHPETGGRISYSQAFKTTFQAVRQSANLRYILLYSNLIPLTTVIMGWVFMQPYALSIGIPIAALGLITFGMHVVRMVGSSNADRLVKIFGEWRWLSLAPFLVVIGAFGMALVSSWPGILMFALVGFGATATRPLIETLILRNAPGTVRSTILSIDMMIFNLFVVLIEPGLGYLGDNQGIPAAFLAMAVFALVSLGLVLVFWRRVWRNAEKSAL
jgi:predicted MFS family arabinose efflux permease